MRNLEYPIAALFVFGIWLGGKYEARKRMSEIESGKRCVNCEETDCVVQDGTVICQLCGHSEVPANVRGTKIGWPKKKTVLNSGRSLNAR